MILMQAPAPNLTFGAMPSGATYVSDPYGLIKILNNSSADQVALQGAGCFTLTPFGGWGTFGFNLLSDLYAADTGSLLPGITGFPQHAVAAVFNDGGNNGTYAKTGAGNGNGNWSQISTQTMASLSAQIASQASTITSLSSQVSSLSSQVSSLSSEVSSLSGQVGSLTTELANEGASAVSFSDTVHLGASNVQQAIVALYEMFPPLAMSGTPPANGTVGTAYSFTPQASGGKAPYTFAQTGSLPPGLSWSATTGLSGSPTEAGVYSGLGFSVTDAAGNTAQLAGGPFTITIVASAGAGFFPDGSNLAHVAAAF